MNSCIKFNILPEQAVWVEHYPADNKSRLEGTFDLVGFKLDQDGTPKQPVWTPLGLDATIQMTGATVMELTGEEPSEMYLEAKRQADIDKAVADALADDDDEEVFNE